MVETLRKRPEEAMCLPDACPRCARPVSWERKWFYRGVPGPTGTLVSITAECSWCGLVMQVPR